MIGYTEMLIEDRTLPDAAHEMLIGISKGTKRLHEIVESMFDIAQIDTRTLQIHLTAVDTGEIVKEVAHKLEKTIRDRQQSLSIEIPPLPMIKADPNLMGKLFLHLLNNAVKFTPDSGTIKVTARPVAANATELPNGGIEIIVSDTGVGVDPDARDVIFSKFYQPGDLSKHSTSKTRFKGSGTGLGLALSKGIVEVHGGRIWVESSGYDDVKFPGSQFHVILPMGKDETMAGTELRMSIP
jgi:signal transduction histidine kinase